MLLITTSILEQEVDVARWANNDDHGAPFDNFHFPTFVTRSSSSHRQRRIRRRLNRQRQDDIEDMRTQQGITLYSMMQTQRAEAVDAPTTRVRRTRVQNDRLDPTQSDWYVLYVTLGERCQDPTSDWGKKFRRRFRVPWKTYRSMVQEARDRNWFPQHAPGI